MRDPVDFLTSFSLLKNIVFTLKKGLAVFLITLMGVCSVYAQEKDWTFWQQKFLQTKADNANDHEAAHFWRTQETHIKQVKVTATLPDYPWVKVSGYRNRTVERCITCHDGISTVSESHPTEFGCSICHGGEPESVDKDQAHATLIYDPRAGTGKRNPSSLKVVEQSCGQLYCHSGHEQEDRNHIQRMKKSMMNSLAGVISGLRYQWAGQNKKTARYATEAIADEDGNTPHEWGALNKLDKLPYFSSLDIPESDKKSIHAISKHPGDRLLRQQCFQCHIDSPPAKGQYRSQGCAACHFTYSKTGLYEGEDPTISKTQTGHAKFHKLEALPRRTTCVKCHRGFSLQPLGNEPSPIKEEEVELNDEEVNNELDIDLPLQEAGEVFIDDEPEKVETLEEPAIEKATAGDIDPSLENVAEISIANEAEPTEMLKETPDFLMTNQRDCGKLCEPPLFAGEGNVQVDVHTARGMDCIDCHTQLDIMGDGNLYSKQHQAVEIRCETCHGNDKTYPLVSKVTDPKDAVIRLSKHYVGEPNSVGDFMAVSERKRRMTNVKVQNGKMVTLGKRSGRVYEIPLVRDAEAHFIPQHRSRLECTACHSQWVVRCPGCHISLKLGQDKIDLKVIDKLRIQQPVLMIGPRGKVAPMLAQPERKFSLLDEKGNPIPALGPLGQHRGEYKEWSFTNPHGVSGSNLAYSLNPHSTGTKVRSCESCHLSAKTLGLGEGDLKIGANNSGKNDSLIPLNRSDKRVKESAFDPQAKVSLRGEILAGSHQVKARPFNQKEIIRILKVGNCIPCHDQYDDPVYQDIKKSYAFERTMKHRQLRKKILNPEQMQP